MTHSKVEYRINTNKLHGLTIFIIFFFSFIQSITSHQSSNNQSYALLGDIGGTNIRFQLVQFHKSSSSLSSSFNIIKDSRMKVKDFQTFQQSINQFFLNMNPQQYPSVVVIALAGFVENNRIMLSNVPKWGQINGYEMGKIFKIKQNNFILINDFQAISYGIEMVKKDKLVYITNNGKQLDNSKLQGVIGPGTGLGHSVLYKNSQINNNQLIVLPSQAGQSDFPFIDQDSISYFNFLKYKYQSEYISLQRSFSGPSIPYMYEFQWKKMQANNPIQQFIPLTSQQIISRCLQQPLSPLFSNIFQLFLKYYSAAIGNFALHHLPLGGIYLVGSLTNSILPKIIQNKIDILKSFRQRHPQMNKMLEYIPIVVCNEVDLGLKGAGVMAGQILKKNKENNIINSMKQQAQGEQL